MIWYVCAIQVIGRRQAVTVEHATVFHEHTQRLSALLGALFLMQPTKTDYREQPPYGRMCELQSSFIDIEFQGLLSLDPCI